MNADIITDQHLFMQSVADLDMVSHKKYSEISWIELTTKEIRIEQNYIACLLSGKLIHISMLVYQINCINLTLSQA